MSKIVTRRKTRRSKNTPDFLSSIPIDCRPSWVRDNICACEKLLARYKALILKTREPDKYNNLTITSATIQGPTPQETYPKDTTKDTATICEKELCTVGQSFKLSITDTKSKCEFCLWKAITGNPCKPPKTIRGYRLRYMELVVWLGILKSTKYAD